MPKLIMTVGLPRSGKSTWARAHGAPIVNPDAIRLSHHGHAFAAKAEPFIWAFARLMVASLFEAGHQVVILDATNTTRKRREDWRSPNWCREFQVFDTSALVCRERALAGNRTDLLPIIDSMAGAFEPPTADELA